MAFCLYVVYSLWHNLLYLILGIRWHPPEQNIGSEFMKIYHIKFYIHFTTEQGMIQYAVCVCMKTFKNALHSFVSNLVHIIRIKLNCGISYLYRDDHDICQVRQSAIIGMNMYFTPAIKLRKRLYYHSASTEIRMTIVWTVDVQALRISWN